MQTLIEILIAAALSLAMVWLWRESGRRFITPVKMPRSSVVYTVVTASGNGEGLEQLVGGLLWMYKSAGITPQIIIEDCGLDEGGCTIARLLERDNKAVYIADAAAADIGQRTAP